MCLTVAEDILNEQRASFIISEKTVCNSFFDFSALSKKNCRVLYDRTSNLPTSFVETDTTVSSVDDLCYWC